MTHHSNSEKTGTFTGIVEPVPDYRTDVKPFEAEIDYQVEPNGKVRFLSIRTAERDIPVDEVSQSSLIRAYAKHLGIQL